MHHSRRATCSRGGHAGALPPPSHFASGRQQAKQREQQAQGKTKIPRKEHPISAWSLPPRRPMGCGSITSRSNDARAVKTSLAASGHQHRLELRRRPGQARAETWSARANHIETGSGVPREMTSVQVAEQKREREADGKLHILLLPVRGNWPESHSQSRQTFPAKSFRPCRHTVNPRQSGFQSTMCPPTTPPAGDEHEPANQANRPWASPAKAAHRRSLVTLWSITTRRLLSVARMSPVPLTPCL